MDEEKRESRVDINELLNKYISDSETSDAAESAKRPRRRMAAKRSPELIDEERPSASYQDDADAAGTYHDDTADTADADDIVDTADTADIADTDDGEMKLPAKVYRGKRGQLYIPCDGCRALGMRWAYADRNNFISFEHESEDKPVTEQP